MSESLTPGDKLIIIPDVESLGRLGEFSSKDGESLERFGAAPRFSAATAAAATAGGTAG